MALRIEETFDVAVTARNRVLANPRQYFYDSTNVRGVIGAKGDHRSFVLHHDAVFALAWLLARHATGVATLTEGWVETPGLTVTTANLEQIMSILRDREEGFLVLSGDDAWTLPLMACGAEGVISVASNEVPRLMREMVDSGEVEGVRDRVAAGARRDGAALVVLPEAGVEVPGASGVVGLVTAAD